MKKQIFYFLAFLMVCSCSESRAQGHFDLRIGQVENGIAVFLVDEEDAKEDWEKSVNENSELNLNFDKISIQMTESVYVLVATDKRNGTTSIIELILDGGYLYEARISGGGATISCSGCESTGPGTSSDCIPASESGGGWYCTDCPRGTCKKTVTHTPRSIIGK